MLFLSPSVFHLAGCMFDDMALLLLKNVFEGGCSVPLPPVVWITNMQRFSRKEEAQCTCLFVPPLLLLLIASITISILLVSKGILERRFADLVITSTRSLYYTAFSKPTTIFSGLLRLSRSCAVVPLTTTPGMWNI